MLRRLRAWWDAPLFSMPHRANERQTPMYSDPDCPPNMMYFINLGTLVTDLDQETLERDFVGWF